MKTPSEPLDNVSANIYRTYGPESSRDSGIQFVHQAEDGSPEVFDLLQNSVTAPRIDVVIDDVWETEDDQVEVSMHGVIHDAVSDLVSDPQAQIQSLSIITPGGEVVSFDLDNSAIQEYPWKPYRYEALFTTVVTVEIAGFGGPYRILLETAPNVLGVRGRQYVWVHKFQVEFPPYTLLSAIADESMPDRAAPFIIRVTDRFDRLCTSGECTLEFDGRSYEVERRDFGDGQFWYPLEPGGANIQVFLPVAADGDLGPFTRMEGEVHVALLDSGVEKETKVEPVRRGLLVVSEKSITKRLEDLEITNFKETKTKVRAGDEEKTAYEYQTASGMELGHGDSLESEIFWRYIQHETYLGSLWRTDIEELDKEIAYRKAVVKAAKAFKHQKFDNKLIFNKDFWEPNRENTDWVVKDRNGVNSATEAIADMFDNPTLYTMACQHAAVYVTLRGATRDSALGKADFDARVGNDPFGNRTKVLWSVDLVDKTTWLPGDWGWVMNNVNPRPKDGRIVGENIIYLGGCFETEYRNFFPSAKFFGHLRGAFSRIKTLEGWFDEIRTWKDTEDSPNGVPDLEMIRTRPKIKR